MSLVLMKRLTSKEQKYLKKIGKKLRELRIENGYSSYDFFAWEHDIPKTTYLNMEHGKNFTMVSLIRVLQIHGISFEEFFKNL